MRCQIMLLAFNFFECMKYFFQQEWNDYYGPSFKSFSLSGVFSTLTFLFCLIAPVIYLLYRDRRK